MEAIAGVLLVPEDNGPGFCILDEKSFSVNISGFCVRLLSIKTSCKPLVLSFSMSLHCLHCQILKPRSPLILTGSHSLCGHFWFNIALNVDFDI